MNARARTDFGTPHRGGLVARATAAVLLLAGVGSVPAQSTFYADLNAAVPGLASQLVANDRLKGKKVLVNVHDFFEERTGRNLPLSETLRQRFRTELSIRGVEVFALPEGSEDEMVILQGVWRELPEPGARPESRKIDLVVSLIERTTDGQRVLPAARGRVDAVEEVLLTPDLDSWGRHLVRELETRAGGRGRRVVHVRNVQLDGAAKSEAFERYLVRRWLLPAFSQSRLFRLAEIGGEESEGALDMNVFAYAGRVEIALNVWDRGVQTASASIEMVQGLLPEHYFRETGTAGQGTGTAVTPPNPAPEDDETPSDEVTALLAACAAHEDAHSLTMPPGANAADCHAQVLERDPGNAQARAGLDSIRGLYAERVQGLIDRSAFDEARDVVERLGKMKRKHPWVAELGARIGTAQAQRLVEQAEAAIGRGAFDEARGVVEQLRRLSPEHPWVWESDEKIRTAQSQRLVEQAKAAIGRGAFDEARGVVVQLMDLSPEHPWVWESEEKIRTAQAQRFIETAEAAIRRGQIEEARGHVVRLEELSPEHPRVAALEGEIARAERRAEERRAVAEAEARRKREEEARRKAEAERRRAEERRIAELTPEMVRIEGGCFRMGSPESETGRHDNERRHEVCVESFSLGKHEVTRGQYAAFVRETGRAVGDVCVTYEGGEWKGRSGRSFRTPGYAQGDTHPVVCVSWGDTTAYARWLSDETGRRYRLATESEWEYAARGGTGTSRYWGDDASGACEYANVGDRTAQEEYPDWNWALHTCRDGYVYTAPVGGYRANGYGLHDMLGNVWEWTCSGWDEGYGGGESRCATESSGRRVIRGGSWGLNPTWVRSATRNRNDTGYRDDYLGFRLAQD